MNLGYQTKSGLGPSRAVTLGPFSTPLAKPQRPQIPTFDSAGRRLRDHSVKAILCLEEQDRVVVDRRRGFLAAAAFRPSSQNGLPMGGTNPISKMPPTGQSYVRKQRVGEAHVVWEHRPLPNAIGSEQDVRDVFAAVPKSIVRLEPRQRAKGHCD